VTLARSPRKRAARAAAARSSPSLKDLAAQLRAAGLRKTAPRVAVLDRLMRASRPVSHAEIADELEHLGLDRVTVYRNLIDLAEAGLVTRRDLGDRVWRFELRGAAADDDELHPHLVCVDCGRVTCLPDVSVKIQLPRGSKLQADALEVQLRGHCQDCTPRS
jgi:Fur family ferric uptake transcriptional regulator